MGTGGASGVGTGVHRHVAGAVGLVRMATHNKAIDADKEVTGNSTNLGKNDPFYVLIDTTGSRTANLQAE